jgi:hypothetical protein
VHICFVYNFTFYDSLIIKYNAKAKIFLILF